MELKEITVYIADTGNADLEGLFSEHGPRMEQKRRETAVKASNEGVKRTMICAGALLNLVLEKHGFSASSIEYGPHGKPFIPNAEGFCFNLSHSGNYLMLAVATMEIGADIQKEVPYRESLAKRILNVTEMDALGDNVKSHFNRVWAAKESYSKLIGEGLSLEFSFATLSESGCDYNIECKNHPSAICRRVECVKDYEAYISAFEEFRITVEYVTL